MLVRVTAFFVGLILIADIFLNDNKRHINFFSYQVQTVDISWRFVDDIFGFAETLLDHYTANITGVLFDQMIRIVVVFSRTYTGSCSPFVLPSALYQRLSASTRTKARHWETG